MCMDIVYKKLKKLYCVVVFVQCLVSAHEMLNSDSIQHPCPFQAHAVLTVKW